MSHIRVGAFAVRTEVVGLAAIFLAVFALSYLVPFSADDWTWGSEIGWARLEDHFAGYNGRYVSNLAILLLTRVPVLVPFLVAAGITLTIYLLLDLTDNRTFLGYGVALTLFLGMPVDVWRQTVLWASGFVNYAASGLAMLVFLCAAKREWARPAGRKVRLRAYVGILLVGFVSTLLMEHVTLYLLAASLVFVVVHRRTFGAFSKVGLAWLFAFLAGAAVMFTNSAYRAAFGGYSNGYQHIDTIGSEGSLPVRMLSKLAEPISAYVATQNVLVDVAVVVLVLLLVHARGEAISRGRRRALQITAVAFLVLVSVLRLARLLLWQTLEYKVLSLLAGGLLLALLVTVAHAVVQDGARRVQLYVGAASVVVLVAPLTLVDPLNPRCFYASYLVLLAIVSVLLKEAVERIEGLRRSRSLPLAATGLAVALYAPFFMAYWVAHAAADARIEQLRAAVAAGEDRVEISAMPFFDQLHKPDPGGEFWDTRFKLYYGLPEDLEIVIVPVTPPS
jgi:hypothetical protein